MNSSNYWGMSSADELPPAGPPVAPAPPPPDAGLYYGSPTDYQNTPPDAPPPPPVRPVGAQLSQIGDPQTGGFLAPNVINAATTVIGPDDDAPIRQPVSQTFGDGPLYGPPVASEGYASLHPKPKGGGVGGPRGPSAYERGVKGLRGTYDEDKAAMQRGATAEEDRSDLIASGAQDIARQKQDDEMMQRLEAANAAKTFADYSSETQRQIDDVRAKTINPNRAYADTGSAVTAVIGGLMGGIYQGLNHLSNNPFIDQMNKTIDRDIAAQETDLRTKKEAIGERKGLLADMRATYKDEALAKIQARNLYYEGAKEELMAQAATYDSPAIQARVDQGIQAINREQSKLDINEAIRKAAAAQAAGAAAEHRRQQDFENRLKLQHAQNETLTAGANATKALKEGDKDHKAAVQHVGDKLAEVDKQGAATDLESLHRYLIDPQTGKVDRSRSIPGVGRLADLRETVAPPLGKGGALDVAGAAGPAGWVARGGSSALVGLSPEERQNKNAYERTFLAFKNIKTGSASSEQEHQRLLNAWEGAKTTEEVGAAVDQAHAFIQRNKDSIRAEDPEATAEFEGNLRAQTANDRTNTVRREKP